MLTPQVLQELGGSRLSLVALHTMAHMQVYHIQVEFEHFHLMACGYKM